MGERITVGIPVFGSAEHLELLLQSIRWYTYKEDPAFDLVVVDDGTATKDTLAAEHIREVCERFGVSLIVSEENRGVPASWNTLTRANPDAEIVVILNDDVLMVPNWLQAAVFFLDANKDNPQVGSCFWQPRQPVPIEVMRSIIGQLAHTIYVPVDPLTNQPRQHNTIDFTEENEHRPGRVMAPCGCTFAFRKEAFDDVGEFPEHYRCFHEESAWGTYCARAGRLSFSLPYPRPYHKHGATFAREAATVNGSEIMQHSRKCYMEEFEIPMANRSIHPGPKHYFNYTMDKFFYKIPQTTVRYLQASYDGSPVFRQDIGGEAIRVPKMIPMECEA